MKKIALEEHFMAPGFEHYEKDVASLMDPSVYQGFAERLPEFGELRLQMMDSCDIELCILSQTSPGLQAELDTQIAVKKASEANDFLAAEVQKQPKRFAGFAHLALQDPKAAVAELQRCINELGFMGALVNGHSNGVYLDDPRFNLFWETIADLGIPLYLHPGNIYDTPHMFHGYPELTGAAWGWTVETATHSLRLIASGLFDRLPNLKIILGHMGECLPFLLWRLDSRWKIGSHAKPLHKLPSDYIKENFLITTSGVCDQAPLMCSIAALGVDNVMFSTDYPFESVQIASEFIETAPLDHESRAKICYKNAQRVFNLL